MYAGCQSFIDLKLEFRNDSHYTMVLSFLQGCINFDICMLIKNLTICTLHRLLIIEVIYFGRLGSDAMSKMFPSHKVHASSMTRTNSSPGMDSSIDRPMRLAEIYVAAEHALQNTICNPELWKSFSSVEEFEVPI